MYAVFSNEKIFSGITDRIDNNSKCIFVQVNEETAKQILSNLDKEIIYNDADKKIEIYWNDDNGKYLVDTILLPS